MRSIAVVMLTASVALSAPMLKDRDVFFYPTQAGDESVYEEQTDGNTSELKVTVTKVEKTTGGHIITVRWGNEPGKTLENRVTVTRNEVTELNGPPSNPKPGAPHLRLPAKEGLTWKFEPYGPDKPEAANSVYRVAREEETVVTPAGTFKAVRVEVKTGPNGIFKDSVEWHAPRVGLVKVEMKVGDTRRTVVLKSFTPGK
ncbi:TapB family protein [Zavarzinella formosa]|uniref:TapB family protein n=1 Tax=Zavarzinella formosa TaxID=360055 RepID=UPI0012F70D17|nr:hypothetical protein [Zavarzinella formosa]